MKKPQTPQRNIRLPQGYLEAQNEKEAQEKKAHKDAKAARKAEKRAAKEARVAALADLQSEQTPKKPRKKHRVLGVVVSVCLSLCLFVGIFLAGYIKIATQNDFLWLDLEQLPHKDATVLYAKNAENTWDEYARLEATQQKIWVPLSEIPLDMQHAFVAIEDKNFYKHSGVSWHRTVFAILNEAKHALTGTYFGGENGQKQGASTIDQQLVKNLTRDDNAGGIDGYFRKVREIYRAWKIDKDYEKDVILEAYLNVISFTGNTAGVEAESRKLFNKSAKDLSLAQCASIAAITKNPYRYDPVAKPENNLTRRNYILYEMWQQGYITEAQYNKASAEDIGLSPGKVEVPETETTSYFTDKVIEDISDGLSEAYGLNREETTNLLYNGGLRIYTTVDATLQTAMEKAMRYNGQYFPQKGVPSKAYEYDENGKKVLDESGNAILKDITEYPQAAMVSIDYNGALRAVVGGLGDKEISRGFNRGTNAVRQVGSTMKPIGAYALALQNNKITWSTPFLDAPVRQIAEKEGEEKRDWPANFSKTYSEKEILVADALAESINTIAVRVGEKAGIGNIYRFMKNSLGITTLEPKDKDAGPMVLGSSTQGITPYELAGAYMMLGNGGNFTTLHCYESVQTGYGREVLKPEIVTTRVLDSDTAYVTNRLLQGVMQGNGTAAGYAVRGEMESVGKTGTSSDNRDYWFVGLTPYYVTATWYGYDSGYPLNVQNGTHAPTAAWKAVMQQAQAKLPYLEFPVDTTVVQKDYCTESGGIATPNCRRVKKGYYQADNLPPVCTLHKAA